LGGEGEGRIRQGYRMEDERGGGGMIEERKGSCRTEEGKRSAEWRMEKGCRKDDEKLKGFRIRD
jgi:hypothetical protein